jgi:hypothetical protein
MRALQSAVAKANPAGVHLKDPYKEQELLMLNLL